MKKAKKEAFFIPSFFVQKCNVKQLKNFKCFLIFFYCISPDFHYNGGRTEKKNNFLSTDKKKFPATRWKHGGEQGKGEGVHGERTD